MALENLLQLFPPDGSAPALRGLYLAHDLRAQARTAAPFVYANFIASLDGRIAVPGAGRTGPVIPVALANERDWRLFMELAAQADILFTTGRYLRDYTAGRAQDILGPFTEPRFADLSEWRLARGLSPQPALAVISGSLDFSLPDMLLEGGRQVLVMTTENAPADRARQLGRQVEVIAAGRDRLDGGEMVSQLFERGHLVMGSVSGPKILHMLLSAACVDRLYLTLAGRLLGGQPFSSIVEGGLFDPPADFRLNTLYYDLTGLAGSGQLFLSFNRVQGVGRSSG